MTPARIPALFGGDRRAPPRQRQRATALGPAARALLEVLAKAPAPLAMRKAAQAAHVGERVASRTLLALARTGLLTIVPRTETENRAYMATPLGRKAVRT